MPLFLARFFHDVSYSFRALAASKSRAFLTMLGVIIGVMSVLAVTSVGLSAQELILHQVKSLGTGLINIIPGGGQESGPPPEAFGVIPDSLKLADVRPLEDIPNVVGADTTLRSPVTVAYRNETKTTFVNGVTERMPDVIEITLRSGRFFGGQEVSSFGRVAVLGSTVAEDLYGDSDPVGLGIRIKGIEFQVIGVLEERGSAFFQDQDDQVLIPVTTAQRQVLGVNYIDAITLKLTDDRHMQSVRDEVIRVMRRSHRVTDTTKDDFTVRTTEEAADILGNVTGAIKSFLLVVTAISLLVGGINVMNVMFVAVRERTREIGLRKALGARPYRIMTQFLIESGVISLIGGAIGVLLGAGITALAALVVTSLGYEWEFLLPLSGVLWSLGVAAGIGLLFGTWPALTASRLEPINALRFE